MTGRVSRWYDRPFVGAVTTAALGRIDAPAVADVRAAAAALIAAAPDGPAAVEIRDGLAWRRASLDPEALAAELVRPTGPLPADGDLDELVARACRDIEPPEPSQPWRLLVGPDHAVLAVRHVVGDASVANGLITGLLLAARGAALPDVLVHPTTPGVTRRVASTMVRTLRPMPRCHPVLLPTDPEAVWTPQAGVAHRVYPADGLRALKAAARRLGVRRTSLLTALVEQALAAQGVAPQDDVRTVVVDCRRYLRAGEVVRGNFATGEALRADWADAVAVDEVVTRSLERARPLLHLVAGSVLARRSGGPVHPVVAGTAVRLRPDYSVVGPLRGATALPWQGAPRFASAIVPYRPDAVGVISVEVGNALQLTLGYDAGFAPPGLMTDVLDTVGTLLDGLGAAPAA